MLISMTGFGKATGSFASKNITVEIKSLNSKQFDISIKMPGAYREKELDIRGLLSELLSRGKVDLNIFVEDTEGQKKVRINQSLALAYMDDIKNLADAGGLRTDETLLNTLLTMPDVLQSARSEFDENEWAEVESVVVEAAQGLLSFRKNEGARLQEDISRRIDQIKALRLEVEKFLPERLQQVRSRIEKNLSEMVSEDQGDKNRLEQEIIYYLEKLDITEEHIRLEGHCNYFIETMKSPEMVGKKLAFIAQEIGREINTMGAKANHVPIQRNVVQMKDELEKIKEQLLNIC